MEVRRAGINYCDGADDTPESLSQNKEPDLNRPPTPHIPTLVQQQAHSASSEPNPLPGSEREVSVREDLSSACVGC